MINKFNFLTLVTGLLQCNYITDQKPIQNRLLQNTVVSSASSFSKALSLNLDLETSSSESDFFIISSILLFRSVLKNSLRLTPN